MLSTGTCGPEIVWLLDADLKPQLQVISQGCLTVNGLSRVQYYAESHGVIYVIDSTDEERLSESKEAFGQSAYLHKQFVDLLFTSS